MADKSVATASRREVICDYCGKSYQQRNLKDHTERVHKGNKQKERHASGQRTIQFGVQSVKRPSESGESSSGVKVARVEDPEDDLEVNELIPETEEIEIEPGDTNVTNEDIMKEIKLSTEVLLDTMKNMQENKKDKDKEPTEAAVGSYSHLLSEARSFSEIADSFSEVTYRETENVLTCDLCFDRKIDCGENLTTCSKSHIGLFKLDLIEEPVTEKIKRPMSVEFRNLKKRVHTHINSQTHQQKILDLKQTTKKDPERKNEKEAGLRCARLALELFKKGRPFTDYPEMVALMVKSDVFMGNINHSAEFPAHFISSVAYVVRKKIHQMLNRPLEQTHHVRPCKIVADKDTLKHRTRQLVCLTTVFPEASDFIQTVYIDHPLIKEHKTQDVAQNVVTAVKQFISEDSYAGCSLDGAYFHAKKDVTQHINEHFNVDDSEVHSDHDPMHRSGLAEKRARKKTRNDWVN